MTVLQIYRHRDQTDARGKGCGDWVKKLRCLRSTNWKLQNSHEDVKYSIGNIVNNIVITVYDAEWVLEIVGGSFCKVCEYLPTMLYT